MQKLEWFGCYDNGWQSAPLVPEAYAHPAKISFGLAERIYRHMLAEGWLEPGARVVDPFGGIGGCAFHAALYGMHWTGIELEPKFVALAQQNLDLWRARYAPHFPGYGTARILQGDSRNLAALVGTAYASVSSPPYADSLTTKDEGDARTREKYPEWHGSGTAGYERAYGHHPGQLGALPAGDYAAAVSSPPYAESEVASRAPAGADIDARKDKRAADEWSGYGDTSGNLGNDSPDTFWAAAREIVAQTFAVLRPGGVAAWICGDFVRNKQRVPFGEQWLALCESVGFEPLAWATAWKQTDHGAQLDIFGEAIPQQTTRVSFFRRLANAKNPAAAILNEDVIFVRKPAGTGSGFDGSVSSPPFQETGTGGTNNVINLNKQAVYRNRPDNLSQDKRGLSYGSTPGQLGAMPAGNLDLG